MSAVDVGSRRIHMCILESDSVASVKLRIQTCKGFLLKKQKLVFEGKELSRNNCQKLAKHANWDFLIDVEDQEILCNGEKLDDQRLTDDICKFHDDDASAIAHLVVQKSLSQVKQNNFSLQPVIVNPNLKPSPVIWSMLNSASEGLKNFKNPIRSSEGTGGAYFMQHPSGNKYVAVFKPMDEEPMAVNNPHRLPPSTTGEGLKLGTKVGEGALREVAAYILDHPLTGPRSSDNETEAGFAGVPPTVMAKCLNPEFNHPRGYDGGPENIKIGSLQMFVNNCGSCEDMGPRNFPVEEVHKIAILDIRTANADRHAGNILMNREGGHIVLTPIDHGYCLPENFKDCTFDWLYWPQARKPYSKQALDYINSLDADQDIALLRAYGWDLSVECARTLRISTMLLKKGAANGLSPFAIGRVMCRETIKKESMIEKMVQKAQEYMLTGMSEAAFLDTVSKIMDFELQNVCVSGSGQMETRRG